MAGMKQRPRGPYGPLQWWFVDDPTQPPRPAPGRVPGSYQHAQYTANRQRMAELGWRVGTIFTATSWEELWDVENHHDRLRELSLERFLIEQDDGWVLQKARKVRGRMQAEIEERYGQAHLLRLLSQKNWLSLSTNYLLARECVRIIPHHCGLGDQTRNIRWMSSALAEEVPSYFELRLRIHASPEQKEVEDTRSWIASHRAVLTSNQLDLAQRLLSELEQLIAPSGHRVRLQQYQARLAAIKRIPKLETLLLDLEVMETSEQIQRYASAMALCRDHAVTFGQGEQNVVLVSLSLELEYAFRLAAFKQLRCKELNRRQLLALAYSIVLGGYGAGLLSTGELQSIRGSIDDVLNPSQVTAKSYTATVRSLERVAAWAMDSIRHAFAGPLLRYTALEPKAGRFVEEVLRSSVLLPLADVCNRLSHDSDQINSIHHSILGRSVGGLLGLYPGTANGKLCIISTEKCVSTVLEKDAIVVLPEHIPMLPPVAGMITIGSGSFLSHLHLLALNLGIPSAALPSCLLHHLNSLDGEQVELHISAAGEVVLKRAKQRSDEESCITIGASSRASHAQAMRRKAQELDFSIKQPISLSALSSIQTAQVQRAFGAKTANAAILTHIQPGSVPQAIGLPFGMFCEEIPLTMDAMVRNIQTFEDQQEGVLYQSNKHLNAKEFETVIHEHIAYNLQSSSFYKVLMKLLKKEFGLPGSYGLFVRSDASNEDSSEFNGAGLNLTLPNVVGLKGLWDAIARVWASPFSQRARAWQSHAFEVPELVSPSVLLMRTVPVEKSGVLISKDFLTGSKGCMVATAWGVGGVVDGEAAEMLILGQDSSTLLSEAHAPYCRRIEANGGLRWEPAPSGAVLTGDEQEQLRGCLENLSSKLPEELRSAEALDIEFGFHQGKLVLFQMRPLETKCEASTAYGFERMRSTHVSQKAPINLSISPISQNE